MLCNFIPGEEAPGCKWALKSGAQGGRQSGYALVVLSWREQEWGGNGVLKENVLVGLNFLLV